MSLSDEERIAKCRNLARTDLYFLLRYAMNRPDLEHPWLYERCREVQAAPDGYLDLWARNHYKSTTITVAKTIQDILASHGEEPLHAQERTIGIFSHSRPIAKKFLRQIKSEFERNKPLREWFPDVLYDNPDRDAPTWSLDSGIIVKRRTNPKEATVEAWGLVDGQPTGAHFTDMVYDDVVTPSSVNTPDMIAKTTEAWELSLNLGSRGGRRRMIGTRYHFNDTYAEIMDRGAATPRLHPATTDGTETGEPVLLSAEELAEKRRDMGPYTFACQMLLNPRANERQGFLESWMTYYRQTPDFAGLNRYILIDPANEKRKHNDYTAAWVLGCGADGNIRILDMLRDRLSLTQRAELLFRWHRKYRPLDVAYEKYGLQSDIEHFRDRMERETYSFSIQEVGGQLNKLDRIKRLVPYFEQGRLMFPETHMYTDAEGMTRDLVQVFLQEEYKPFPVMRHDDMLDALSRLCDLALEFPNPGGDLPELRTW